MLAELQTFFYNIYLSACKVLKSNCHVSSFPLKLCGMLQLDKKSLQSIALKRLTELDIDGLIKYYFKVRQKFKYIEICSIINQHHRKKLT